MRRRGASRRSLAALSISAGALACAAGNGAAPAVPRAQEAPIVIALPEAPDFSDDLQETLRAAWTERPEGYEPRTRHLEKDGRPRFTNRLFLETSPYLRQHAHNPVNWYPWGNEAFREAKRREVPVLVSIGYSTCHWCHVMEEESFDDLEIAAYLNAHYVAIKVDREERPDVDSVYMSAVQVLTGQGGWPLNVWLTTDREPYYGGTYFPPRSGARGARIGFLEILQELKRVYDENPAEVARSAKSIRARLATLEPSDPQMPGADVLQRGVDYFRAMYDPDHGGRKGRPKFPSSFPVRFLLTQADGEDGRDVLRMATHTLREMAEGGIYDQVAGGFHRYSVDERWLVPHFEKMLYDNALLAVAYLDAWQLSGDPFFERIADEILAYVRRDMTSPAGAFYSATDADSETPDGRLEEGWFFTWTPAELRETLGKERAARAEAWWAVTEAGNFEGRNILHAPHPLEEVAARFEEDPDAFRRSIVSIREALYEARAKRPAPLRDEKILASWNGLMISAFAQSASRRNRPEDARVAAAAADFLLTVHRREDGGLWRVSRDGRAKQNAYLDDYAFLIAGLLDLYEADGDARWIEAAFELEAFLAERFEDAEGGGFFVSGDGEHEALLLREKPAYDGAEPSGNSVHAMNLLRLHAYTADEAFRARADRTIRALGGMLVRTPAALTEMLLAIDFREAAVREIVIVVPEGASEAPGGARAAAEPFLEVLRRRFDPHRVLVVVESGEPVKRLSARLPILTAKSAKDGTARAYVCLRGTCKLPTTDPEAFAEQLDARGARPGV